METYLRCIAADLPNSWYQWLSLAEYWYNKTYHSIIKMSPFEALYGNSPPLYISYFTKDSNVATADLFMRDKETTIQLLKHHLSRAAYSMKKLVDKHRTDKRVRISE